MARKFSELRGKMSPERQRKNDEEAKRRMLELTLQELRQRVSQLSQVDLAEALEVTQGYVSKLERQEDMTLSRLYAYVEALGGHVEILAHFPNGQDVRINQFEDLSGLQKAASDGTR